MTDKEVRGMTKYKGSNKVGKGTYWDLRSGTRIDVEHEGVLPGGVNVSYRKASPVTMLLAAPFVGLAYVIALPFIAIGTVLALAVRKIFGATLGLLGSVMSFTWSPGHAYLAGKKKCANKQQAEEPEPEADNEDNTRS
jgi:hypothetical protein